METLTLASPITTDCSLDGLLVTHTVQASALHRQVDLASAITVTLALDSTLELEEAA